MDVNNAIDKMLGKKKETEDKEEDEEEYDRWEEREDLSL